MGAPLHCYTCVGESECFENWGMGEAEKLCCGDMVEATNIFRLHPTSISYIQSVLAP
jgi:hypothetical protein